MDNYDSLSDASWDAYNAGVEAWLQGDSEAAYDLNQLSIGLEGSADTAWDQAGDVWSTNELTTVSTYETVDTSWAADTSYTATATADSYSYTADTTSYDTSSYSSYDTSSYSSSYSVDTSSSYSAE